MPQDTSIIFLDTSGNRLAYDSLPQQEKDAYQSMLHTREMQEYYDRKNHSSDNDSFFPFLILLVFILITVLLARKEVREEKEESNGNFTPGDEGSACLTYNGDELNFPDEELEKILNKHIPYFNRLGYENKLKFLNRVKNFIEEKIFVIHDSSGFKEMPILISAAAVQVSFGLDKYLLPQFSHIHIFPEEFIGVYPTLRMLEGNVSGNTINLSWKHFLNGFKLPDDGQNVGLHEMAHAYYYQNFETREQVNKKFVSTFGEFNQHSNKVLEQEKQVGNDLYSDYGLRNFQEFWAESIELFFEKPAALQMKYPELFDAIKEVLNQDMLA